MRLLSFGWTLAVSAHAVQGAQKVLANPNSGTTDANVLSNLQACRYNSYTVLGDSYAAG